jgi:hypothetical protein
MNACLEDQEPFHRTKVWLTQKRTRPLASRPVRVRLVIGM